MLNCLFCGASQTVTGSLYFFEYLSENTKPFYFCIDAGMFQSGYQSDLLELNSKLLFDPKLLKAIILTHAHLDHCGRIPYLVNQGFGGKIYSTPATKDIANIVMLDSSRIYKQEEETNIDENFVDELSPVIDKIKKLPDFSTKKSSFSLNKNLYDSYDVETTMHRFKTYQYHEPFNIHPNLQVEFFDAGHILGSSSVILTEISTGKKVVFSGDLGNKNKPIIKDPEFITKKSDIQAIFIETTYGNKSHPKTSAKERLKKIVATTFKQNGIVLIPAFSVERSQEIIYYLIELQKSNEIANVPIFLDSPMAIKILEIFYNYPNLYDLEMLENIKNKKYPLSSKNLKILETPLESKQLNTYNKPCIIIAGSGMLTGGRILKHLQFHIQNPNNTLLLVGYQAKGTLGRKILDGEKKIILNQKSYSLQAKLEMIGEFSAHADKNMLKEWVVNILTTDENTENKTKIFLTHGEPDQANGFSKELKFLFKDKIEILYPEIGEKINIF